MHDFALYTPAAKTTRPLRCLPAGHMFGQHRAARTGNPGACNQDVRMRPAETRAPGGRHGLELRCRRGARGRPGRATCAYVSHALTRDTLKRVYVRYATAYARCALPGGEHGRRIHTRREPTHVCAWETQRRSSILLLIQCELSQSRVNRGRVAVHSICRFGFSKAPASSSCLFFFTAPVLCVNGH
jgi:hypothetical protein